MNTKFVLMMLMTTAVILVFEAETVSGTRCVSPQQCREHCTAKGCNGGKCIVQSNRIVRCLCNLCSK
uniref:AKTx n=1 Tax=Hadrurus spadix TaxID=141984 RepID=A0A1W7RB51_9SCOR